MSAYHLAVPNTLQSIPVAEGFIHRVSASLGLEPTHVAQISKAAALAVEYAVMFAYPEGRGDQITLDAWVEDGKLHVTVHDNGLPLLPGEQEDNPELTKFESWMQDVLDQAGRSTWRLLGYGGKELLLQVPLSKATETAAVLRRSEGSAPVDAAEYVIRALQPKDAPQVTKLVYRVYGHTYDDEDYYYPEKIVAENQTRAMISVVAVHPSGEVVGHYALEQREPIGIYEGSSAVVNNVHRGKGLMERMREFATDEGRRLGLKGLYFLPWTVHTLSQKANEHFGAKVCAANLSDTSPVAIKGFEAESLVQRVSTMLYFVALQPLGARRISLPERHRPIVGRIYELLGCDVTFLPYGGMCDGATVFTTSSLPHDRFAEIRVLTIGSDLEKVLGHQLREQTLHHGCETVYLNLPLSQAGASQAVDIGESLGFSFLGVGPEFADDGDMLRMAYMAEPLDPAHIHVLNAFGQELVDYALAEAARVNG